MAEKKIDVQVTRSKRKSMKMSVRADGSVVVEAPNKLSKEQILNFIEDKKPWIISKVNQRLAAGQLYNQPIGRVGERFSYLGRDCQLHYEATKKGHSYVKVTSGKLIVGHTTDEPTALLALIEQWYRDKTKEEVEFWIKCYQPQFETVPNRIVIKDQKRRWGSCSSKQNLNFNWRLSMMPTWVISYIVLHELCHFEEMNHSEAFWAAIERRMPEYRTAREWLSQNGHRFLPI